MSFRRIRLQGDGPTTGGDRLIEPAHVFQNTAEIGVGFDDLGLDGDGLMIGGDRRVHESLVP